jgi:predicted RNA binding protein YcfA (HicA-like mRNA interferase family)
MVLSYMDAAQNSPVGFGSGAGWLCLSAGGKGSHRKFRHPKYSGAVILSGKDGDDAHHYQEKQIRNAIREVTR